MEDNAEGQQADRSEENNQPSLRESLETSLEILAEDPVLRVLLKRIPLVGDSLTEIAAGKGQQIIEARRDEFLGLLAEHIAAVEEQAIRSDYFQTPEGLDLLFKALDESRKTRSREKRDLYARVLSGAIVDFERREYSPEEYLNLISDLTLLELNVARSLYLSNPKNGESWEAWKDQLYAHYKMHKDDLPIILSRIQATGLIKDVPNVWQPDASNPPELSEPTPVPYEATASFKRMMRFLGIGQQKELT